MEDTVDIKQRRLAVLNEACNHFNSTNRSKDEINGGCFYYPPTPSSEGCAVGRLIKDKELCKSLDAMDDTGVEQVFDYLPNDVQELGKAFLNSLQLLHDTSRFWNEKGLTEEGVEVKEHIIKHYCS